MTRRTTTMVTAAAAVVMMIWVGAFASNGEQAAPTAVAVVDVEAAFTQLKQRDAIEAELRARGEELQAQERQMKAEIGEMQEAMGMLPPGSSGHKAKQLELEKALVELKVWGEYQQQRQNRERAVQIENLYNKTLEAIGDIAEESGYDLVLFKEPSPNFQGSNIQQMMAQLSMRKTLWSRDSIDITRSVTTRMNNEFDAGQ